MSFVRSTTALFGAAHITTRYIQDKLDEAPRARDASKPQLQLLSVLAAKISTAQKGQQAQAEAGVKHRAAAGQASALADEAEQLADAARVEFGGGAPR